MKIIVEINGQEIELSIEEAKRLYRELSGLLGDGEKVEYVYYPLYPYYPTFYPPNTTIPPNITCKMGSGANQ